MDEERYYWETKDGRLIPVHELTDLHICNIVMYFGKQRLSETGHSVIVDRFENLNKEYNFFDNVNKGGWTLTPSKEYQNLIHENLYLKNENRRLQERVKELQTDLINEVNKNLDTLLLPK